jgi:hypothetical protein
VAKRAGIAGAWLTRAAANHQAGLWVIRVEICCALERRLWHMCRLFHLQAHANLELRLGATVLAV